MPTDTERRYVARRLRRVADKYDGVACTIVEGHLGIECDERFIGGSVYTSESVKRLADLIDPDTTTDTTKSAPDTTKCDRDALLALAGCVRKMGEDYDKLSAFGLGTTFRAIADRIREALGASDG